MKKLRDFAPLVVAQARLCPLPLVLSHLRKAAKEYLEESCVWRMELPPMDAIEGVGRYNIFIPPGTSVCLVQAVRYLDNPLTHVVGEGWPDFQRSGPPELWRHDGHGHLSLYPIPEEDKSEAIRVSVVLSVDDETAELPDWLDEDALVSGALARLLILKDQPWASPEMALFHRKEFRKAIAEEKIKQLHGGAHGSLSALAPPFGG